MIANLSVLVDKHGWYCPLYSEPRSYCDISCERFVQDLVIVIAITCHWDIDDQHLQWQASVVQTETSPQQRFPVSVSAV